MVDYSKLSDFEINKAVALTVNPVLAEKECYDISGRAVFHDKRGTCGFSFISDPADAWPIIADSKITMLACDDLWIACPSGSVIDGDTSESQSLMYVNSWSKCPCMVDINPLRAAMIVFLMMQDAKNG